MAINTDCNDINLIIETVNAYLAHVEPKLFMCSNLSLFARQGGGGINRARGFLSHIERMKVDTHGDNFIRGLFFLLQSYGVTGFYWCVSDSESLIRRLFGNKSFRACITTYIDPNLSSKVDEADDSDHGAAACRAYFTRLKELVLNEYMTMLQSNDKDGIYDDDSDDEDGTYDDEASRNKKNKEIGMALACWDEKVKACKVEEREDNIEGEIKAFIVEICKRYNGETKECSQVDISKWTLLQNDRRLIPMYIACFLYRRENSPVSSIRAGPRLMNHACPFNLGSLTYVNLGPGCLFYQALQKSASFLFESDQTGMWDVFDRIGNYFPASQDNGSQQGRAPLCRSPST